MKKYNSRAFVIALLVFFCISCSLPWLTFSGKSGGIQLLADSLKNNQSQPTSFQPFYSTVTPTRNVQPITNALVPAQGVLPPDGQINILILGSDWRENSGSRTDVVLLMSVFTKENKVSLVSFPRDLWVTIPNLDEERINTAMGYGGFPLLASTFEYNFGIHVDHYMMTNFNGFKSIVDTLGGVDVDAYKETADRCDLSYLHGGWCSIGPGKAHLDGELALWYVRSRYTSNDFDRTRRSQEMIVALFNKLMSLDAVSKAPELYELLISSVETDMTLADIMAVMNVAPTILADPSRVRRYALGLDQLTPYTFPSTGAYVLLPDYTAVWQVIQEAVYTP